MKRKRNHAYICKQEIPFFPFSRQLRSQSNHFRLAHNYKDFLSTYLNQDVIWLISEYIEINHFVMHNLANPRQTIRSLPRNIILCGARQLLNEVEWIEQDSISALYDFFCLFYRDMISEVLKVPIQSIPLPSNVSTYFLEIILNLRKVKRSSQYVMFLVHWVFILFFCPNLQRISEELCLRSMEESGKNHPLYPPGIPKPNQLHQVRIREWEDTCFMPARSKPISSYGFDFYYLGGYLHSPCALDTGDRLLTNLKEKYGLSIDQVMMWKRAMEKSVFAYYSPYMKKKRKE